MKIVEKSAPAPKAPKTVAPTTKVAVATGMPNTLDELRQIKGFGASNVKIVESALEWAVKFGQKPDLEQVLKMANLHDHLQETIAKNSKGKFADSAKSRIQERVLSDRDLLKAIKYLLYRSGKNAVGIKLYMGKDHLIHAKLEGPFDMNPTATPDAMFFEPVRAEDLPQLPELFAGLE